MDVCSSSMGQIHASNVTSARAPSVSESQRQASPRIAPKGARSIPHRGWSPFSEHRYEADRPGHPTREPVEFGAVGVIPPLDQALRDRSIMRSPRALDSLLFYVGVDSAFRAHAQRARRIADKESNGKGNQIHAGM